jgi:thiosulfate/3-mercaptopyruvate sulfurtransferase
LTFKTYVSPVSLTKTTDMNYTTFITAQEAEKNLQNPDVLFIDCSFSLADEHWGLSEYEKKHIPNAV